LGFAGAGSAIALWLLTIPTASGWSSTSGSFLLVLILALAGVGAVGAFMILKKHGLAAPLLFIAGLFHLVYPWAFPGLLMLMGAALSLWETLRRRHHAEEASGR
jgi:hypothetical protein